MRTLELCRYAGISLRQAQWWSEHQVLHHETRGNQRIFDPVEARRALVYGRLRQKGLALSVIRGLRLKQITGKYLATDGRKVLQTDDCTALVEWISWPRGWGRGGFNGEGLARAYLDFFVVLLARWGDAHFVAYVSS